MKFLKNFNEVEISRKSKSASSVGIEPTTSRLTVERANRLRHEDWFFYRTYFIYIFTDALIHRFFSRLMKTYFLALKCEGLKIFLTFCFGPFPLVAFPICKIVPSELCFKHCTPNSSSSIYFLNISFCRRVQLSHII